MSTIKAVIWNLDIIDKKVINESISILSDNHLIDKSKNALTDNKRKRVSAYEYASHEKYRSKL